MPEGEDPAPYARELPPGEEGELCASGPGVMVGYHNKPEATKEVIFTMNGMRVFRTGDLAVFKPNGSVKITGRVKEIFKLMNGKYVVPSPVEETLSMCPYILQNMLLGANQAYTISMVVPDTVRLAAKLGADPATVLTTHKEQAKKLMQGEIDALCRTANIKSYERPHDLLLVSTPFTQANNMMTPKTSLRRKIILDKFSKEIEEAYLKK